MSDAKDARGLNSAGRGNVFILNMEVDFGPAGTFSRPCYLCSSREAAEGHIRQMTEELKKVPSEAMALVGIARIGFRLSEGPISDGPRLIEVPTKLPPLVFKG